MLIKLKSGHIQPYLKKHIYAPPRTISQKSHNPLITAPIIIEDQAWVAADVFIGPGVTIGQGAVVGARACVYKNIEPWTVVGGNPAIFIKKRVIMISAFILTFQRREDFTTLSFSIRI